MASASFTDHAGMRTVLTLLLTLPLCPPTFAAQSCELDHIADADGAAQRGAALAASDDTVLLGARGSLHVSVRERVGTTWVETQQLSAPSAQLFGSALDVEGDLAAIGAPGNGSMAPGAGAVYVYVRSAGSWQLLEILFAPDAAALDGFGSSISLSMGRLAVGAPGDDSGAGSVYTFVRGQSAMRPEAKLSASDGEPDDAFGFALDLGGTGLVVGAPGDDDAGAEAGAVYVFERLGQTWIEADKLTASDAQADARYGHAVTISDPLGSVWLAFVGAPFSTSNGPLSGTVYQLQGFIGAGGGWVEPLRILGNAPDGSFGFSLDMTREARRLAVGAPTEAGRGRVHVLEPVGNPWITNTSLTPTDAQPLDDGAGRAVAVNGDVVVVGTPFDDVPLSASGSVSFFAVTYQSSNSAFGSDCNGNGVSDLCDVAAGSCPDADSDGVPDPCQTTGGYCQSAPNSTGVGGVVGWIGSTSVADNSLRLVAEECPAGNVGLFFYGTSALQQPFGDGFRCVGGSVFRLFPLANIQFGGVAFRDVDFSAPPAPGATITPGSTWHFQFWFRDPGGPGGSGFNLTDGLSVTFCP